MEAGIPVGLPKGVLCLASGSTDMLVQLQIKVHAGLQAPPVPPPPKCLSYISKSKLVSPDTHLFFFRRARLLPLPVIVSLFSQIVLAMSSLLLFLSALDSSRCLWMFSFSYIQ